MKKSGLAFHCHHDVLFDYVYDYDERVDAIKEFKPPNEHKLRLRLFKLIPENRLPAGLNKALAKYTKAQAESDKVLAEHEKAEVEYEKARAKYEKAWAKCKKVWVECRKTLVEYEPFLIELHKELCPNCPWNGTTIFTRKNKAGEWYYI